jgi:hypothetical protein
MKEEAPVPDLEEEHPNPRPTPAQKIASKEHDS